MTEPDFSYVRWGHLDQGRLCDKLAAIAFDSVPGEVLPQRWMAGSPEAFVEMFGEGVYWSKTASYHLMWISGMPIIRIWTNTVTNTTVDVEPGLGQLLEEEGFSMLAVPSGTLKKRPELLRRAYLTMPEEIGLIMELVKVKYGLGHS